MTIWKPLPSHSEWCGDPYVSQSSLGPTTQARTRFIVALACHVAENVQCPKED